MDSINYYVLFDNYTHGLALHKLLHKAGIMARISPTPYILQQKISCGMSLLVLPEHIESVKACIAENNAKYKEIAELPCQINPERGRFC